MLTTRKKFEKGQPVVYEGKQARVIEPTVRGVKIRTAYGFVKTVGRKHLKHDKSRK